MEETAVEFRFILASTTITRNTSTMYHDQKKHTIPCTSSMFHGKDTTATIGVEQSLPKSPSWLAMVLNVFSSVGFEGLLIQIMPCCCNKGTLFEAFCCSIQLGTTIVVTSFWRTLGAVKSVAQNLGLITKRLRANGFK